MLKSVVNFLNCFLITSYFILFPSCKENKNANRFSRLDANISFRLLSFSELEIERKINKDDYVLLNVSFSTQADSLFWDTRHFYPQGYYFRNNSSTRNASFQNYLSDFSLGDSIEFLIRRDSFFFNYFHLHSIPNFCKNDTVVKANVKIEQVFQSSDSLLFFELVNNKLDSLKRIEKENILRRVKQLTSKVLMIDSSIYLYKSQSTTDSLVKNGKIVTISYRGYLLDGKLVDYSPETKRFEWKVGEKDQLLPGIQLALFYLRKGEKAKIILPSRFAFGENGSSGGFIPPFTPLEYEIEILNLK